MVDQTCTGNETLMILKLGTAIGCLLFTVRLGADMGVEYRDQVLPTLDGAPLSLTQYRGQKVLLMDFASW